MMSFKNNDFIFFGEMTKNIDFYLLDSEKKELIKSKLKKIKTTSDLFDYYSNNNININTLFQSITKLEEIYSNIYEKQNHNNQNSKLDKYISDLSNIILLFNLISKNQKILRKAITKSESYLETFYFENSINKNSQKKLDQYLYNLINMKKGIKKKSLLFNGNSFNKLKKDKSENEGKSNIFIFNKKTEKKNIKFNYQLINFAPNINNINSNANNNGNNLYEEKKHNALSTPKFPKKTIEDNINNILSNDIDNDFNKNNILKQESIQTYFTLAEKIKPEEENQKPKKEKKENIIDIINQNDEEAKLVHSKSNELDNNKVLKNPDEQEQKSDCSKKAPKNHHTFSSMNLKNSMEKNMVKNLLVFLNNSFKNGKINSQEKLKLKQLIIAKSEKIEKIYNIDYKDDINGIISELKKLIV